MTDETKTGEQEAQAAVAEMPPEEEGQEKAPRLKQSVELKDIGPCKKHIKVIVDREGIDELVNNEFSKLVVDSNVAGFRPGKAPRKIIEKRFQKEVFEQVRGSILLQSLEQLAEENNVAPLTPPNIDPSKIIIPEKGPLVYEFDVEVRPEFELPSYKGLKLKRPLKDFTQHDVEEETKRILAPHGSMVPKPEGEAEVGDYLVTDLKTTLEGKELASHQEITIRIDETLALKDGVAENFGKLMKGVKGGETRVVPIVLSDTVADDSLRGKTVEGTFVIKEIKKLRLPELDETFLDRFGVTSVDRLHERVRAVLQRRLEYTQRQAAREQVLQLLAINTSWELPQDLLVRQSTRALRRRIVEMRSEGMAEQEIQARMRMMQRDIVTTTAALLKEHFVLQKIAELEKIEITEDDINDEIERMAAQSDEPVRRVRARLEKEDLMEALATEIIERKALDLILSTAEYEDVPLGAPEKGVATMESQAVAGEMRDPAAEAEKQAQAETPA